MPRSGPKFVPDSPTTPTGLEIVCAKPEGPTMQERLQLVYNIAKYPAEAAEMLQSWTRKEILQVLFHATGKERKYTGLPKSKIIENLLKEVSKGPSQREGQREAEREAKSVTPLQAVPSNTHDPIRKQRKDQSSKIPATTLSLSVSEKNTSDESRLCKNLACKAALRPEDKFCKRCSCCICHEFDDNKDPSLWLTCNSDPPYEGASCGLSCHVECILKQENSQIQGDGSYCCVSCGKVNGLIECLKKQLSSARDARRVGALCYRIYISYRLLKATVVYKELYDLVESAVNELESEVGPLKDVTAVSMERGIVSRLSSGLEVQRLCALALEKAEYFMPVVPQSTATAIPKEPLDLNSSASRIQFEYVSATSLCVILSEAIFASSEDNFNGYKMWHRRFEDPSYPEQPTLVMQRPGRYHISNLQPLTDYSYRIIAFTDQGDLGHTEFTCTVRGDNKGQISFDMKRDAEFRRPHKIGLVDLNSTCLEDEAIPNGGASTPKVRDLGKIMEVSCAQNQGKSKDLAADNEPFQEDPSCRRSRDQSSTPERKKSWNMGISCNLLQTTESEEAHGDSVSALDEERAAIETGMVNSSHGTAESQKDSTNSSDNNQTVELPKKDRENHSKISRLYEANTDNGTQNDMEVVPFRFLNPPVPLSICKVDSAGASMMKSVRKKSKANGNVNNVNGNGNANANANSKDHSGFKPAKVVSSGDPPASVAGSKKRAAIRTSDLSECKRTLGNGEHLSRDSTISPDKDYEYCVKVIRRLECAGYIQKDFRLKFLTWFSLRATSQEKKIVGVFVETMIDDPASLAGQLVDTFSEGICSKRAAVLRNGFCSKLWH